MLTPGQIAQTLDISTATLRRWSARFAPYLSPHTPGKKRSYTVDDLAVLTRVRDLSATGTPLAQIDQALEGLFADNAKLQEQINDQQKQISQLVAWVSLPWYKRIGKPAPAVVQ